MRAAEFGADQVGVGVVYLVEDAQCLCPGPAGRGDVARALVAVAEMAENQGFGAFVVCGPDEPEGCLVGGDGLAVAAQVVVGVADAVPGARLALLVIGMLQQAAGLLAERVSLALVAQASLE